MLSIRAAFFYFFLFFYTFCIFPAIFLTNGKVHKVPWKFHTLPEEGYGCLQIVQHDACLQALRLHSNAEDAAWEGAGTGFQGELTFLIWIIMNTKFTTWQKKRIIMARGCLSYTFFLLFFERRINDSRNQLLKNICFIIRWIWYLLGKWYSHHSWNK